MKPGAIRSRIATTRSRVAGEDRGGLTPEREAEIRAWLAFHQREGLTRFGPADPLGGVSESRDLLAALDAERARIELLRLALRAAIVWLDTLQQLRFPLPNGDILEDPRGKAWRALFADDPLASHSGRDDKGARP